VTIQSKKCFKCEAVKPLEDFYKHPRMGDGRVNKCKECNKLDVRENRSLNADYYREYDRKRGCRQDKDHCKNYRKKFVMKYAAHRLVGNRVRSKELVRQPCEVCGTEIRIHAHHDDYALPLVVRWLCAAHHSQWHKKYGEGKNPF